MITETFLPIKKDHWNMGPYETHLQGDFGSEFIYTT